MATVRFFPRQHPRFDMKAFNILLATILFPAALAAQGQVVSNGGTVVQGGGNNWTPSIQGSGTAAVTTDLPCGTAASGACSGGFGNVGNGSLRLGVTGIGSTSTGYQDWAFYYQNAAQGQSFGNLRQLSSLSFDWFRTGIDGWGAAGGTPADWRFKTPVVRLQLAETRGGQTIFSEIIWEGYYNQNALAAHGAPNGDTPVNTWVAQTNMQNDAYWYIGNIGQNPGYSASGSCNAQLSFWQGGVTAANANSLFSENGCLFGADVNVIGIAVGVGSQWPLPWDGAVDNVRMSFSGTQVINANFDVTTVPEPSTYLLMGAGLLALGVASRSRNRRSSKD